MSVVDKDEAATPVHPGGSSDNSHRWRTKYPVFDIR